MKKPGRLIPALAIIASFYVTVLWGINGFVGDDGWIPSLSICLLGGLSTGLSCWWMSRRLDALDEWKEERAMAWFLKTDFNEED